MSISRHLAHTKGGLRGFWTESSKRWRAQIKADGTTKHLGCFVNLEEAITVRKAANIQYGYHENHGAQQG